MAGQPLKRARFAATMARMGADLKPAGPKRKTRGSAPPDLPGPSAAAPAARETADFEMVLSGMTGGDLDAESNKQFSDLRAAAFAFAQEVMDLPLDAGNKHFAKIISVKQAIATAVLTATTRVRPGDLREKDDDGVGALLDDLRLAAGEVSAEDLLA